MAKHKISRFKSKILEVRELCDDVKHYVISTSPDFNFTAGQFISIILKINDNEIRRPYSIASKPTPNSLDLCIKILPNGYATPTISKFKVGDEIEILGPMGGFVINEESLKKNLVLISTGTGITPFRSMTHDLLENNFKNKLTLITGYRYEEHCLYEPEFHKLEKSHPNFSYQRILSRPRKETKEKGHVQLIVERNIDKKAHYYICGLKEMINSVKELLIERGIPKDQIFFEKYD